MLAGRERDGPGREPAPDGVDGCGVALRRGLGDHEPAHQVGSSRRQQHRRDAAERLADDQRRRRREPLRARAPRRVRTPRATRPRAALAAPVAARIGREHAVRPRQPGGRRVPLARVAREAVQQERRRPVAAVVGAAEPGPRRAPLMPADVHARTPLVLACRRARAELRCPRDRLRRRRADCRALCRRGGRARAARDQARARVVQHGQGAGRDPGRARRRRRAVGARRGRDAQLARDGRSAPRRRAHRARRPAAIERLERFGVAFTHDADGRYRLARCGGATRKRLLQVGDRTGHAIATALRAAVGSQDARIETLDHAPLQALDPIAVGLARDARAARRREPRGDRRRDRARGRRPLLRRGQAARHVLDQRRRRDRRGDRDRAGSRLRGPRPRRAAVPPERRPLAGVACRGTRSPRRRAPTAPLLLNASGERFVDELGGRDVVAAAIVRECEEGRGLTTPEGRPSVLLDCRPIAVADAEISLPYMLKRYRAAGIDPLARADPHLSGAALPERRPRDRRARRDHASRACTPPARSRAACTGATA